MRLYITRDSVCAADDLDAPHACNGRIENTTSVGEVVAACLDISPLPNISGGKATWCLSSGVPLAVIAQQWTTPKLVSQFAPPIDHLDIDKDGTLRLHFTYFVQRDPHDVRNILSRLQLRVRD